MPFHHALQASLGPEALCYSTTHFKPLQDMSVIRYCSLMNERVFGAVVVRDED